MMDTVMVVIDQINELAKLFRHGLAINVEDGRYLFGLRFDTI